MFCNMNVVRTMIDKLPSNQAQMTNKIYMAKGDSAASIYYWRKEDVEVLSKIKNITDPSELLPNKDSVNITSQG